MEQAVVGAAVGATIKVLLQNLISASTKKIKLIRGFKKDMEKLRSTLITVQEFIYCAETLQVTDDSVKRWLKKLEDVAFKAYYFLDEIDYLSPRNDRYKMETKESIFKKNMRSITSGSNFYSRCKLGHKIRDINKEFESINREASGLGLPVRLAGFHATGVASLASSTEETDSFTSDPVFLGRDDDVKRIVEKLNSIQTDQVFSILPIVGMGGMGKSTLAREVLKVQTRFETHIWVHVSANFDPIILFNRILVILTSKDVKVENREVVLKKLKEALADKTYLLVLDDVWNEEGIKWEGFINSLSGITSTKGNAIIVTTRKKDVASIVATLPIHDLKGLHEQICWSIIKAKAFGAHILPEFETLGKNIAKKCRGLPLAANVVGGVLRGKSKDEWHSIQENWLSAHIEGDFIQKVLKLSIDNLPSPSLKKCFACCSIFPKGALMRREELIELWMAEGYLEAGQRSDMETVGNNFFNLLLHNSLILQGVPLIFFNNALSYSMHDLVHDVAMKVNDNISDGICRALYTHHEFYGNDKVKYVRTLFFGGGISDAMFSNFKSLHALTLMGYSVEELPCSIQELMHLRYLNISETRIKEVPYTIGELYHLLTLTASFTLMKLPSTLKYLISLRHLHVPDYTVLPGELGKLTSLQTIPCFRVGEDEGHRIVELGSLVNLKGKLEIHNLENVRDREEAKSACIFQKPNIAHLVLRWNMLAEGETDYENVLEGLQPHPNLKSLKIYGFRGTRFPSWCLMMAVKDEHHWKGLDHLTEITLESCSECEEIPMMGHLPHLKALYLVALRNVKSISSSFYGIDYCISNDDTITVFPALQRLELWNMPKMREWVEVELVSASENQSRQVKVFPCLEYLVISTCKELRSAPCYFPCLKEVNIAYMDSGLPLANICGTKLTSLTKLRIWGLEELESLPHGLFYNNQHLSELQIQHCAGLRELPDGMNTHNSLQKLMVYGCPSLKSSILYCSSGSFTSLCVLSIVDCGELMNSSCQMLESCAASLEKLDIGGSISVTIMQMIIDCLHKTNMPRLTTLWFTSVPKIMITPKLHVLRSLRIHPDSNSWDCISFKEVAGGMLQLGSNSLRELDLRGMVDWDSLPNQIQHLSALSKLTLSYFGIEELPEWFGNLSSLRKLTLSYCKRLSSMPSAEAMRRLTNLKQLEIWYCPVLKERGIQQQSEAHDSQWPKISHLPSIMLDGCFMEGVNFPVYLHSINNKYVDGKPYDWNVIEL